MWSETHQRTFAGLSRESVWAVWEDVNNWHRWDQDIEYARTNEPFRAGARLELKPKAGPNVKITVVRAERLRGYTDLAVFPLARMYGIHDMMETPDGLRLTITILVEGPLGWLWKALVAKNVAAEAPAQMESLAAYIALRAPDRAAGGARGSAQH